jgi:hypothetical protein
MTINQNQVFRQLKERDKNRLLQHFNSIYECTELTESEERIIYLAWLWGHGFVGKSQGDGASGINTSKVDAVDEDFYLLSEEDLGVHNLDNVYSYYELNRIIELLD